jgi:hypothetical protein
MPFSPDQHADRRGAGEAVGVQVPARLHEYLVSRGRQAGEVRHGGAGHEADIGVRGEAEELQQPSGRTLLDGDGSGCCEAHAAVLIPRAGQPVRGQSGRQGPSDHPAEEAAGRHRHQPRLNRLSQQVHDRRRIGPVLGQRASEVVPQGVGRAGRRHGPAWHRVKPGTGMQRSPVKGRCVSVLSRCHGTTLASNGFPDESPGCRTGRSQETAMRRTRASNPRTVGCLVRRP